MRIEQSKGYGESEHTHIIILSMQLDSLAFLWPVPNNAHFQFELLFLLRTKMCKPHMQAKIISVSMVLLHG